ncbi:MAG: D-alanyl-D-alanine carboxypeptidase/D-alanyl-D-alanine-endopeptidase [Pseudomonadota bacterium]
MGNGLLSFCRHTFAGTSFKNSGKALAIWLLTSSLFLLPTYSEPISDFQQHSETIGFRYGISVTDLEGNVLLEHRANERFMPASTAKLFVTAAALEAETALASLDTGLKLVVEPSSVGSPTLVLIGRGDPTIGSGETCRERCLETLVAAVKDAGLTEVGDIVGDDQWFADERVPLGWSWDDLKFWHGTSISALSVNDNTVAMRVSPAKEMGDVVSAGWWEAGSAYFKLQNEAVTGPTDGEWALRLERLFGARTARLYGEMPLGSRSTTLRLGVEDPAHFVAWSFKTALEAEGIDVSGEVRTQRRPLQYEDEAKPVDRTDRESQRKCAATAPARPKAKVVASLDPAPLQEIITKINRDSHNLYAEVLLRQLGRAEGPGSSFCGLVQIEGLLERMGLPRDAYEIADGSGLSNYNRTTPAALTALLRYAAKADWGERFQASLPVGGGRAGTLRFRFRGTSLDGKIFAKTGTLNHVDALAGYMEAESGEVLVFAILANDRPLTAPSVRPEIDALLLRLAKQY